MLLSGVTYDVIARAHLRHVPASTAYRSLHTCRLNGVNGRFVGTVFGGDFTVRHAAVITGTGEAIAASVRGRLTATGSADYSAGLLEIEAHPRR